MKMRGIKYSLTIYLLQNLKDVRTTSMDKP